MGVFTIAKIVKIKMDPSHWLVTYSPLQLLVAIEAAKISKPPFPSSGLVIFSQQVARIERLFLLKCIFPTRCPSSSQRHSLCSAGLLFSSATVIFSHTTPATSSSSNQSNNIFLSQHFSSSLPNAVSTIHTVPPTHESRVILSENCMLGR